MTAIKAQTSPADFDRWDDVHALLTECFAPMEGRIDPPSSLQKMTPTSLAEYARAHDFVVLTERESIVGFGLGEIRTSSLYLSKLAVHPDGRGQGKSRHIIELFEKLARNSGLVNLTLQTRVELIENHATFRALGFQKTDETRHPGYDRVTSYTFTKSL